MTAGDCPVVTVRMIPGRSITVRSGASGDVSSTTTEWVLKPLPAASASVSVLMTLPNSRADGIVCVCCGATDVYAHADLWLKDSSIISMFAGGKHGAAHHCSPLLARFMTSRMGHLVTRPEPLQKGAVRSASPWRRVTHTHRGKGTPLSASNTELFPELWSPTCECAWAHSIRKVVYVSNVCVSEERRIEQLMPHVSVCMRPTHASDACSLVYTMHTSTYACLRIHRHSARAHVQLV
jgi:hypothetical protein